MHVPLLHDQILREFTSGSSHTKVEHIALHVKRTWDIQRDLRLQDVIDVDSKGAFLVFDLDLCFGVEVLVLRTVEIQRFVVPGNDVGFLCVGGSFLGDDGDVALFGDVGIVDFRVDSHVKFDG